MAKPRAIHGKKFGLDAQKAIGLDPEIFKVRRINLSSAVDDAVVLTVEMIATGDQLAALGFDIADLSEPAHPLEVR